MTQSPKVIHYHAGASLPSDAAKSVQIMHMCAAWGNAGHDVTLFVKKNGNLDTVFDHYGVEKTFKVAAAPNMPIPFFSGLVRIVVNWFQSLKHPKPDVIYGRDMMALILQKWRGVCVVPELHQLPYLPTHRLALKVFDRVVVISDALKQSLLDAYPDFKTDSIFVYHDCATLKPDESGQHISLQNPVPNKNIGYAGSLHAGKGGEMSVKIASTMPGYQFHIWGGNRDQIKTLQSHMKHKNISFYGHMPHNIIHAYLSECDVLIAPYAKQITIKTGRDIAPWISPLKLFEYMAVKKPMIVSRLPVIEEVLRDADNAVLVTPDDVGEWKYAIQKCMDDHAFAHSLADNAYRDLKNYYTWDKRAAAILFFCLHHTS